MTKTLDSTTHIFTLNEFGGVSIPGNYIEQELDTSFDKNN